MTMVLPEKANRERRDLCFKIHLQQRAFEGDGSNKSRLIFILRLHVFAPVLLSLTEN